MDTNKTRLVSQFPVLLAQKSIAEQRRISLKDVERETGVARSTIIGLVKSSLKLYPAEALLALCKYFSCSLDDLLKIQDVAAEVQPGRASARQGSTPGWATAQ
jgi:DNA-binding Xre family transcriptional regulator